MKNEMRKTKKREEQHRRLKPQRTKRRVVLNHIAEQMRAACATLSLYGTDGAVEYVAVAIHRGSHLIDNHFFDVDEYSGFDEALAEATKFTWSCEVEQVKLVDGLHEPEFCDGCGERTARIADVLAPSECHAIGLPTGSRFEDAEPLLAECN